MRLWGLITAVICFLATGAQARDQIKIVGSSELFPFTTAVAEEFGGSTDFATPVVEPTGSGGGLKLFCAGVGPDYPDITQASRRITQSEFERCQRAGVTEIIELQIGSDGLVLANSRAGVEYDLRIQYVFQALARFALVGDELVPNPFSRWSDIDPSLPDAPIQVFVPLPTTSTQDNFVKRAMLEGARRLAPLNRLYRARTEEDVISAITAIGNFPQGCADRALMARDGRRAVRCLADSLRDDVHAIETGEDDNLIRQRLQETPNALAMLRYSFFDKNRDFLRAATINGAAPAPETIASGEYPISFQLYLYVKKQHFALIPGLTDYVSEIVSIRAIGPEGYLADSGLVPLPFRKQQVMQARVDNQGPVLRSGVFRPCCKLPREDRPPRCECMDDS